jgi:hypothetical protein
MLRPLLVDEADALAPEYWCFSRFADPVIQNIAENSAGAQPFLNYGLSHVFEFGIGVITESAN